MLLLMKKRQQATKEDMERENRRIRASKRDVSDLSDDEDLDSDIEQLQSRVRYRETDEYNDSSESSYSSEEEDVGYHVSIGRSTSISDESNGDDGYSSYDDGYESSDMEDERHEMQAKIQKKYRDPRLVKSIEIQKRSLDATDLSVKKIESKKKLNVVWEGIIQRYSALGEDEQGDVVNLKNMSIEENTGHIEQLQRRNCTSIWDEFVHESEGETVHDPLNLLLPGTPRRKLSPSKRSFVTPVSMSRRGTDVLSGSRAQMTIPPPMFELSVTKNRHQTPLKEVVIELDSTDDESELDDHHANSNHDPLNLLSPKKSSRSSFSSSQSTIQNHDPFNLLTPQRTKPIQPQSTSMKRNMRCYEDYSLNMMTPKKPKVPPSTRHLVTPTRNNC